ncbi:glycosyltransferase [Selenomonas ruminantium]|uniref:glycosyltransferase n=1 Tax=Selenomonas ruminantium TaxID=971 RepID=UPI0026E92F79|nr:glycosyltransferase [Selenomonas ruminantium]
MNTDMPLISVIIPLYNAECYLRTCIDSLLRQSYVHIEILLIDDGSTDGSGSICDSYAIEDSRVKAFHIENGGAAHARNYGIKRASGEYLVFVDSDDFVEAQYVEQLYTAISEKNVDLAVCDYNEIVDDDKYPQQIERSIVEKLNGKIADDYAIMDFRFLVSWGGIYRLKVLLDNDVVFPEDMVTAEDQIFNDTYFNHIDRYAYVDECLYNYRIGNDESLSSKINLQTVHCEKRKLKHKREFFDHYGVKDKERILLSYLYYYVFKYNDIDNECIEYTIYPEYDGYTFNEKMKILILKMKFLLPFIFMHRFRTAWKRLCK